MHREITGPVDQFKIEGGVPGRIRQESEYVAIGRIITFPPSQLPDLLEKFVAYFNDPNVLATIDPLECAAFAHLWLVRFSIFISGKKITVSLND